jgi:transposase
LMPRTAVLLEQFCQDREAYRLRNRVERLINRLKQARRIAIRYEKRGDNYLAMIQSA